MAARFSAESRRDVLNHFGLPRESTTSDLIDFWCKQGYDYIDVLKMLGIATRMQPREHMELGEWLQKHNFEDWESHDSVDPQFEV